MIISLFAAGLGVSLFVNWIITLVILAYLPVLILLWTKNISVKGEVVQYSE